MKCYVPDRYRVVVIWGDGGPRKEFGPYDTHSDGFRDEQVTEEIEAWKAEHPDQRIRGSQQWGYKTVTEAGVGWVPEDDGPDLETVP